MRRAWEIGGFVTIAAALHVSAAALMLPDELASGAPMDAPPAALSAGSGQMAELIAAWETPPEAAEVSELETPEDVTQPDPAPTADRAPQMAAMTPAPVATPEVAPVRPNLPEPPPDQPQVTPPELPELQSFDPPEIPVEPQSDLALQASERPLNRPARPRPQAQQPKRAAKPDPQPAPKAQPAQQQRAAQSGGGAGGSATQRSAGGGGGGQALSASQQASLMSQWGGQIRNCISRRAAAPRGVRQGGRVTLALRIGRNGAVQGVGVAGSSGVPQLDQAAVNAAKRAGRCPAAPAGLGDASYSFQLPINLQVR